MYLQTVIRTGYVQGSKARRPLITGTSVADPDPSDRVCFLGLPDLLVRDQDPDHSILSSSKNSKKIIDSYCFVTFYL